MSRTTGHVVLLLLGFATAVMVVKGTYLNYVKPSLLPWLIAAAVVLVVLGGSGVVEDLRRVGEHEHEHGHTHRAGLAWLLLVPIAMLAFVVPPPLDVRGTTPTVAAKAPALRPFPPLPAGPAPEVPLPEAVMRAAADAAHSLDDATITLTGFTINGADGVDLGRVVIVCCAADAQLARVHLDGPLAAGHPEDAWLRVVGRIERGSSRAEDDFVPTMKVAEVTRIEKPKNAYSY
jgi:putative membrane protein